MGYINEKESDCSIYPTWCIHGVANLFSSISSIFKFDNNAIMGFDKLIADVIITIICYILIVKLGIKETAGFNKKGFEKGLILGIPFIIIGIGSVIFSNIGTNFNSIKHISIFNTLLYD